MAAAAAVTSMAVGVQEERDNILSSKTIATTPRLLFCGLRGHPLFETYPLREINHQDERSINLRLNEISENSSGTQLDKSGVRINDDEEGAEVTLMAVAVQDDRDHIRAGRPSLQLLLWMRNCPMVFETLNLPRESLAPSIVREFDLVAQLPGTHP